MKPDKLMIIYKDGTKTMPVEVWINDKLIWDNGEYLIKYRRRKEALTK